VLLVRQQTDSVMNQSNLYTYSILTITWNDLDCDVFKLVKEYLRVHLNRKMLNNDYNVFLDNYFKKEGRHRFKMDLRSDLKKTRYYAEHYNKYFIMGEEIYITKFQRYNFHYYNKGCHNHTRRNFISSFQFMFNELSEGEWNFNIEDISDDTIKMYIRHLMDTEERLLLKNTQ
tara:strand:- start:112 stop:630 length:519 start_codon:yes stop_codon:yes gene_type:complete